MGSSMSLVEHDGHVSLKAMIRHCAKSVVEFNALDITHAISKEFGVVHNVKSVSRQLRKFVDEGVLTRRSISNNEAKFSLVRGVSTIDKPHQTRVANESLPVPDKQHTSMTPELLKHILMEIHTKLHRLGHASGDSELRDLLEMQIEFYECGAHKKVPWAWERYIGYLEEKKRISARVDDVVKKLNLT